MKRYNKTSAAVLSGAVIAVIGAFVELPAETLAAIQTLITAVLVWAVPNAET